MTTGAPRVLVLTADTVGPAMAGPAIRAVSLSRVLAAAGATVTLASAHPVALDLGEVATARFTERLDLEPLVDRADVVVAMTALLERHEWIAKLDVVVVADAYDPALFEVLEWFAAAPVAEQEARYLDSLPQMVGPLRWADHVLCASERQRHLVLGMLTALGRINPHTYAADRTMRDLVGVVPFGLPDEPPTASSRPLRAPLGPFADDDLVLLWGGGIYEWLDPVTLVEGVAALGDPTVKVFFAGGDHPTPEVPVMPLGERTRRRVAELGLGAQVAFADGWIPYEARADHLLDADVGVSLHGDHLETTFSFRTRMLDYVWAGLPVLCSGGDGFAETVAARGWGEVAAPGDVAAVAQAIARLADPDRRAAAAAALAGDAADLRWSVVAAPLVAMCLAPRRAADREAPGMARPVQDPAPGRAGGPLAALRRRWTGSPGGGEVAR